MIVLPERAQGIAQGNLLVFVELFLAGELTQVEISPTGREDISGKIFDHV